MSAVEWTDAEREAVAFTKSHKADECHYAPGAMSCSCGTDRILAALAPFVAAREAQAAAKALREAADAVDFAMAYEWPEGPECRDAEAVAEVWLRDRADRIERGESS